MMQSEFNNYNPKLKSFAKKHRKASTKEEVRLWCEIFRKGQLMGFTFMRQRPIGTVLRFWDDQVLKDIDGVKKVIVDWILINCKEKCNE